MTWLNQEERYLVTAEWLATHIADSALRIFDCTMLQTADAAGVYQVTNMRDNWAAGHIPGAGYIDLAAEFSDRGSLLRFTLPPVQRIAEAMSRHGVSNDAKVILYSSGNASWATRAWWVMRCAGFYGARVLDGGYAAWLAESRPVCTVPCAYPATRFVPEFRPDLVCDRDAVLSAIDDADYAIVNALTAEQHLGIGGMTYGRPGHIASSCNVPWRNLTEPGSGRFRPADQLRRIFADAGVTPEREALVYCGAGIAAAAVFFALKLAGYDRVRLYDNSLQEWAADPTLPMAVGPSTGGPGREIST